MNKKLLSLLLCAGMILGLGSAAFADTETASSDLPDIDITSWEYMLANEYNSVGPYIAQDVSFFYGQGIDARIYDDAVAMIEACRTEGYPCYIVCANRDWNWCLANAQTIMKYYYDNDPVQYAENTTAPGCNEHQLGLAFDITANPGYADNYDGIVAPIDEEAKDCDAWHWLEEHCAEYGFIVRYPEGKEEYYGIACNPTHLRYVGKEAAEYITENNLCLEEFLMLYGVKVNLPK